ncbi:hypothetical protein [Serratia inhibens]|uniref:hypothetical protein n=1 Tax=Serratia inhibens TaxID=2338073 RepID=UPI003C7B7881
MLSDADGIYSRLPLVDFQLAFGVIGVIALLAVVDSLTLNPEAGSEVSRKKSPSSTPTGADASTATKARS